MLPGFRFLFAATALGLSVLVFGLGAAALLRAAHEDFASNPSWRTPPEPRFAQQDEPAKAVLAVLSVQPPAEPKPADVPVTSTATDAATEPPSPESEATVAPGPSVTTAEGAAMPAAETAADAPASTVGANITAAEATTIALPENTSPAAPGPATSASQPSPTPAPMTEPATPGSDQAATTGIATLGGPPVAIAQGPAGEQAKEQAKAQAKEHSEQRRLAAHRARLARQAAAARQTFNPFNPNPFAPAPLVTPAR